MTYSLNRPTECTPQHPSKTHRTTAVAHAVQPFKLQVKQIGLPVANQALTFAQASVSIGRDERNDVLLRNGLCRVSRHHALIHQYQGRFWLMDQGSKNATWLNGYCLKKARPYPLRHGDCLTVGDYKLCFMLEEIFASPLQAAGIGSENPEDTA